MDLYPFFWTLSTKFLSSHDPDEATEPHVLQSPREPDTPPKRPVYDRLAAHYEWALGPLERRRLGRLRAESLAELPAAASGKSSCAK